MNKTIASVAITLCLLVQSVADAQQRSRAGQPGSSTRQAQAARPISTAAAASRTRGSRPGSGPVKSASHEHVMSGEVVYEDGGVIDDGGYVVNDGYPIDEGYVVDGGYSVAGDCASCGGGGCSSCGIISSGACTTCAAPNQFCICFPSHGWVHAEYLNWYPDGMNVPALVTTSNPSTTARANAGVMGLATTSVLYGANDIMDDSLDGFRIRFGWWLAAFPLWGIEGEYVGLGEQTESYFRQSTGTPILARPFFNVLTGREDAELVAFPSVIGGSVAVDATTRFDGAAVRFRRQLCCSTGCGYSALSCQTVPTSSRLDGTVGYRFWELKESLQVEERLTSQVTSDPGSFVISDRFETRNLFNGAELGVLWQGRRGWWSLDMLMRLGIGNINQSVTIQGTTATTVNGTTTNRSGGLLAQRTNIGSYEQNHFTMVPELGATLGYQVSRRLRATVGYSLVYIGNVVRPGDQIDLDLNPNLLPPENVPFTGALRPQFDFVETDYLIQGLSFGGEFRW